MKNTALIFPFAFSNCKLVLIINIFCMLLVCCVILYFFFFCFKYRKHNLGFDCAYGKSISKPWRPQSGFGSPWVIRIKSLGQICEKHTSSWMRKLWESRKLTCSISPTASVGELARKLGRKLVRDISKAKPKTNKKDLIYIPLSTASEMDWQSLSFICPKLRDLSYSHLLASLGLLKKDVSQMKAFMTSNNMQQNHTFLGNAN